MLLDPTKYMLATSTWSQVQVQVVGVQVQVVKIGS